MKRIVLAGLVISLVLFGLGAISFSQETLILGQEFKHPRRPRVVFDHDTHNEKAHLDDCSICHHVYKNGKLVEGESSEDQKCSSCHKINPEENEGHTGQEENEVSLREAYHKRCIGCHLKRKKGPIMCNECHKGSNKK